MPTPRVIDLSHHNVVRDLRATASAGVWGVIHKATQGKAYPDPEYAGRRVLASEAGLLWGAYHFGTADSVQSQVSWFLNRAKPDDRTLMVLDYEDNRLSQMHIEQAVEFLREVERKVGRKAAIYSGHNLKDDIGHLSEADRAYVCSHRLWLSQYGPAAHLPAGFKDFWLWQFTDGHAGPPPHSIPGIAGAGIDINTYTGTRDQLEDSWA